MIVFLIILVFICLFPNFSLLVVALAFWGFLNFITWLTNLFKRGENKRVERRDSDKDAD